jgi:hypothetical protein
MGKRFAYQRRVTAQRTDERVRTTQDVFAGIAAVKSACWEEAFQSRVFKLRQHERNSVFLSMAMKAIVVAINFATPYAATLLTFAVFFVTNNDLTIPVVFSTLSLIQVLRLTISKNLFRFLSVGPEAATSVERMRQFLLLKEVTKPEGRVAAAPPSRHGTVKYAHAGGDADKVSCAEIKDVQETEQKHKEGSLESSSLETLATETHTGNVVPSINSPPDSVRISIDASSKFPLGLSDASAVPASPGAETEVVEVVVGDLECVELLQEERPSGSFETVEEPPGISIVNGDFHW